MLVRKPGAELGLQAAEALEQPSSVLSHSPTAWTLTLK